MEDLINEEIQDLFGLLDRQTEEPLKMSLIYNLSVVNALWTLLTGSRLSLDDEKLKRLVEKIDEMVKEAGNVTILNLIPGLRHVIPELTGWNKTKKTIQELIDFISDVIDKHRLDHDKYKEDLETNPNDFIDAFLNKINDEPAGSSFHGDLGK